MPNLSAGAFDTGLLARLERYRLKPRKTHAGRIRGERLSPQEAARRNSPRRVVPKMPGSSVESVTGTPASLSAARDIEPRWEIGY